MEVDLVHRSLYNYLAKFSPYQSKIHSSIVVNYNIISDFDIKSSLYMYREYIFAICCDLVM
jgi:DNA-binding LytR/AlgR family response regulator